MIQFKSTNSKKCWLCSSVGDSREHKHKKTDFKRVFGESEAVILKKERKIDIQGPGSDLIKFDKVLCSNCNTTKTQPFDRAYDKFIIYVNSNFNRISNNNEIDFSDIFNSNPKENKRNVLRYYLKHFGCRLVTNKISIEPEIIDFINGSDTLNFVYIKFEIRMDMVHLLEEMNNKIGESGNLYTVPLRYLISADNNKNLELVYSWYNYQWFRIYFFYSKKINESIYNGYNKYNESLKVPVDCLYNVKSDDNGTIKKNKSDDKLFEYPDQNWLAEYLREDVFKKN